MTPRARNIRAHLFTAGLYALLGDSRGRLQNLTQAERLLEPSRSWPGGLGAEAWS